MTVRVPWRTVGAPALVLLLCAGSCRAAGAPSPSGQRRDVLEAGALAAVVEFMAARAEVDSVAVHASTWAGLTRNQLPPAVWERIRAVPGLDPTALADFARGNAVATPVPRLPATRVRVRYAEAPGPGVRIRLSRAGVSASGQQALVAAESWCGEGCAQGELFLLRRDGGEWNVASQAVLFIS